MRRRFVQMKKRDKFHIQEGVSVGIAADGTAADGAATACIGPSGIAADSAAADGATAAGTTPAGATAGTAVSIVESAAAASTIGKRCAHTIKKWSKEEMPRERFVSKGAESLSNAELLA
ncbi:MAG: hypothetical protein PUC92_07745, partial [bacterium]|nr:hypothetical protein [bacterium]